jgi:hypothetical protein
MRWSEVEEVSTTLEEWRETRGRGSGVGVVGEWRKCEKSERKCSNDEP